MNLNFDAFLQTLPIMGLGMLGIFIVTVVLIAIMMLFNALTRERKKKDDPPNE